MKNKVKVFKFLTSLIWEITPWYLVILFINGVLSGTIILFSVLFSKYIIDALLSSKNVSFLFNIVLIFIIGTALNTILLHLCKMYIDKKKIYIQETIKEKISIKIMDADYFYLEDPSYLDKKENAVFAIENQNSLGDFIDNFSKIINNVVTLVELIAIMSTLSFGFLILIICIILIMLIIEKKQMKYQIDFYSKVIPVNRKLAYYEDLTFEDRMQREIRLYQMDDMIYDKIEGYNVEICGWLGKFYKKRGEAFGMYSICNDLLIICSYGYTAICTISKYIKQNITIGDFTMYASAAISFSKAVISIGESLIAVMKNLDLLQPFYNLMSIPNKVNMESKEEKIILQQIETIQFDKVSFRYPNSDKDVLKQISFQMKKGDRISIVGLNGAGKTTIVKLICKLYHPTEGVIRINNIDINRYEDQSYIDMVSVVFQDFKLFPFSVTENIACTDSDDIRERVINVLDSLNMKDKILNLPYGLQSVFDKEYDDDAIELSGGQNQKIAIARALYKDSQLIILDEPTSALDPMAEMEIFEYMKNLVRGKTSIFISHRMSSCTFSDKILVISDGRVEAFDTHKNLLENKESTYYKLFMTQAKNYI